MNGHAKTTTTRSGAPYAAPSLVPQQRINNLSVVRASGDEPQIRIGNLRMIDGQLFEVLFDGTQPLTPDYESNGGAAKQAIDQAPYNGEVRSYESQRQAAMHRVQKHQDRRGKSAGSRKALRAGARQFNQRGMYKRGNRGSGPPKPSEGVNPFAGNV